jgi:hypothetical protein
MEPLLSPRRVYDGAWGPMESFWTMLNNRALSVSIAHDAFAFEISWLGIILIVGAMLLWRYLRR